MCGGYRGCGGGLVVSLRGDPALFQYFPEPVVNGTPVQGFSDGGHKKERLWRRYPLDGYFVAVCPILPEHLKQRRVYGDQFLHPVLRPFDHYALTYKVHVLVLYRECFTDAGTAIRMLAMFLFCRVSLLLAAKISSISACVKI